MSDVESMTQEEAMDALTAEGQAMGGYDPAPAPTVFEDVQNMKEDEVKDDAAFAELMLRVSTLEATVSAGASLVAELAQRIAVLEGAAPAKLNAELEAKVEKMYEKMKYLIPMD